MKHLSSAVSGAVPALVSLLLATTPSLRAMPQGTGQTSPTFAAEQADTTLVDRVDGGFAASGAAYVARFESGGARIAVADPTGTGEANATFRLVDHGRPGATRAVAAVLPTRGDTDLAEYRHDGIVERYRVGPGGFEQSFVLPQRPAGHGDYVIGIAVYGDGLALPRVDAAHQALELRHGDCPSIRYGEAIAFERGGQPVEVQTRCDGAGRIELVVPAALLDTANYPVIIDPAVGPVLVPSGASLIDHTPDVAQNVSTGNYLFVWQRQLTFTTEIRGRLYSPDGNPLTGVLYLTASGQCRNPSVCTANLVGDGFLVAYEWADIIRIRCFSASSASALTGEYDVSSPPAGSKDRHPSVSGGAHPSVILVYDRTPSGGNQPTQILASHIYHTAAMLFGSAVILESVSSGHVQRPRIARTSVLSGVDYGTYSRAVWERFYTTPTPGDYDVRTATLRARLANVTVSSAVATVAAAGSIGSNEHYADIAMMADDIYEPDPLFLIAWDEELDIKAQRYTLSGPLGNEIDIRSTTDTETGPAVGAGDCEFTVGYMQSVPPNEFAFNVRAARVLEDGTVAVSNRPVDVLNGPFQAGLRASSLPPHAQTRGNTTMLAWYGETGPSSGLNDVRARMFEPVVATVTPYGSACAGPGGTLPTIGTNSDPIPGNDLFYITLTNAPANSLAVLLVGDVLTTNLIPGAPGCNLYMGLPVLDTLASVTSVTGYGAQSVPIPCSVPSGVTLAFQWGVLTPGHNAFGWITSDDLDVNWSHF